MKKDTAILEVEGLEKEMRALQSKIKPDTPRCEVEYLQKMIDSTLARVNTARWKAKMPAYGTPVEKVYVVEDED